MPDLAGSDESQPPKPVKVKTCFGCMGEVLFTELRPCRCLGCDNVFWRCETCAGRFVSCHPLCRGKHREKLGEFFGPNAPKLKPGEGLSGPEETDLDHPPARCPEGYRQADLDEICDPGG